MQSRLAARKPQKHRRRLRSKRRGASGPTLRKMIRRWFWGALSLFLVTVALQGQSRESVLKAVALNSKWSPTDKPIQYDERNIETLAGKRAATINHYGFVGATMQKWSGPNGNVRLTLYEMADASAAYGLFSLERSGQSGLTTVAVGTEGF